MRRLFVAGWVGVCALLGRGEDLSSAVSPDGRNEIRFKAGTIQVFRDGRAVTGACRVGLEADGAVARPELHAANEGVAYRWVSAGEGLATVRVERAEVSLPSAETVVWAQQNPAAWRGDPFQNTWQNLARRSPVKDLSTAVTNLYFAPFVVEGDGWAMGVTETDLRDYPGWNFRRSAADPATLTGIFAGYPAETASAEKGGVGTDGRRLRYRRVLSREPYLVKTQAKRTYPWRVFMLADSPVGLIGNGLVRKLAAPSVLGDASWVKPGKVAWDWWNAFDNRGPAGCTTETYLRFVDFAAKGGLEYVILDEGWSEKLNIWKLNDRIDLKRILAEAGSRGVGIILWLAWDQARGLEEEVAAHFAAMGVKGFKVDFIDRDDAEAVRFYETFAAACARHRLLVDFHGSFKPAGLETTYPNIVNYEGVYGLEQLKWKGLDMIENDAALPYVRGLAGMMDYTPGAMDNYARGAYRPDRTNPGSLGTRVHQLALMTLFSGRLQMLCDSPSKYERERECFTFLAKTPVVWDETRGLLGTIGKNCVMARRAGTVWTVAAIADWDGASFEVPLDFLGKGEYKAEVFADTSDADVEPMRYRHDWFKVRRDETLPIRLAPGGGWVARFNCVRVFDNSKENP